MMLAKNNLLLGLKNGSLKRCSHCLPEKQKRVAFKRSQPQRKPGIPEVVYSDVRGPFNTRTLGGSLYFVTFIDIHSRNI